MTISGEKLARARALSDWLYGKEMPNGFFEIDCFCGCNKTVLIEREDLEVEAALCIKRLTEEIAELRAKAEMRAVPVASISDSQTLDKPHFRERFVWISSEALETLPLGTLLYTAPPAQAVNVPIRWKLVPIEPTPEMSAWSNTGVHYNLAERIYENMLNAAPQPEKQLNNHLPIQPLAFDAHGVLRFEQNPLVQHLLDVGPIDMNHLAIWCHENNIDDKYQEQFAQLIGYSLSGFGSLSYVSDTTYSRAEATKPVLDKDH